MVASHSSTCFRANCAAHLTTHTVSNSPKKTAPHPHTAISFPLSILTWFLLVKVSAMDAAAQLVHCGIDHLHRASPFSPSAGSNYRSRNRRYFPSVRRNAVVRAIATEPKPSETKRPKDVNGTPKPAPYTLVNGGSTVGFIYFFLSTCQLSLTY